MSLARVASLHNEDIHEIRLANAAGAEARVLTFGAVLRDLVVPDAAERRRPLVTLGHAEEYLAGRVPYLGAVVGRYANRIGGARFRLAGEEVRLVPNENGNQLHGGPMGFSRRLWTVIDLAPAEVTLALVSADGDMGYPGRLVATCRYELLEPATLRLSLEASADRATPVNLTTHAYWNLDGSETIDGHRLAIAADRVTPTGPGLVPTGALQAVAGGPYDFRTLRAIAADRVGATGYDINFALNARDGALGRAAVLESERNGLVMELWTTEPGLQFYDGHLLDGSVSAASGRRLGRRAGLCLEPQRFPDGPNQPQFPPSILEPGLVSRQVSEFRFGRRPP